MPFYEYVCESCEYFFEEFQNISDDPIKMCPQCKKESVKRLISLSFGYTTLSKTNAREYYENKIKPEAKQIAKKIKEGDEDAAADFFGEDKLLG